MVNFIFIFEVLVDLNIGCITKDHNLIWDIFGIHWTFIYILNKDCDRYIVKPAKVTIRYTDHEVDDFLFFMVQCRTCLSRELTVCLAYIETVFVRQELICDGIFIGVGSR